MRLWSLHPRYLDARGLVALWREALLAQAVLKGQTRGYTHHPQLVRFKQTRNPIQSIASYLQVVHEEATARGYNFDRRRIGRIRVVTGKLQAIPVTRGQLRYEWSHLHAKLARRDPKWLEAIEKAARHKESSPIFQVVPGPVEAWEKRPV
ncbi:MAG TPA: pyrimidine dimer DNA glycosylase/endonuclease V [Terriglobia bacterium]|nr:pyrimidine dimer DNA glycosylase/endonuclease V [Terriglobia bacterium]